MISQPTRFIYRLVLIVVIAAGLSACSSQPATGGGSAPRSAEVSRADTRPDLGLRAAEIALEQVGVPYRYGGSTPSGFDCSGLVYYSYSRLGKSVPRTTNQLLLSAVPVERNRLRAGDVLFFSMEGKVSHVGLYLGDDQFVHAPSTGKRVSVQTLKSEYYERAFVGAGRPR